ncbi:hypothetical protein P5673_019053 [Acropora cervicornis]|uniref:Uncharacterized protein n=1 Tax=Acropora cervicornis TaxID=6130 RepID=A0AAD9QCK7_ACRCE|nr:hypothetical protein P5673_019053 [Acropora cervicornis]
MRERWRRSADDIMERQLRPVEFNDLVAFMDREARIATNPVFGNISATSSNPSITTLSDLFQRISSWYRLKKVVAWILRYRSHLLMASKSRVQSVQLKSPVKKPSLISVEKMERAEKAILQNVQQTAFPAKFHQLTGPSGSKHVRRSSPLFKLDPVLRNVSSLNTWVWLRWLEDSTNICRDS